MAAAFGFLDMFNVLNTFVFMTNTGFGFDDRVKADILKANGGTKVRIWAGQSRNKNDMTGHVPDFRTYNFDGSLIGEFHGNGKHIAAGGFVDVMIPNDMHHPHVEPFYLKMFAGGDDGICISSLAIEGPNQVGMMFWPELLIPCDHEIINRLSHNGRSRTGYADSIAMVGKRGEHPKCVWFDRNLSYGLKLTELTLHLPDLLMAGEKAKEWHDNKELFCKPSPRMLPAENRDARFGLYDPIWTFNPTLDYNITSGLELDSSKVLGWRYDDRLNQLGPFVEPRYREGNDRAPKPYTGPGRRPERLRANAIRKITDLNRDARHIRTGRRGSPPIGMVAPGDHEEQRYIDQSEKADPWVLGGFFHWISTKLGFVSKREAENPIEAEESLALYNNARQLVVLNSSAPDADSATSRCTLRVTDKSGIDIKQNPGDNPDYLSLDEQIYCDMLMTTMFPVCQEPESTFCFDQDILMLRRLEAHPDPAWIDHGAAVLEGSEQYKKMLRRKRAIEAVERIEEENRQAAADGTPITYLLGQPRPLWNRPYHPTRVIRVGPKN